MALDKRSYYILLSVPNCIFLADRVVALLSERGQGSVTADEMCAAALYISPSAEEMTEKNGAKLKKVVREIASIVAVSAERHRPAQRQAVSCSGTVVSEYRETPSEREIYTSSR